MKYIGSGLWALAAAYLEVSGLSSASFSFAVIALLMAIWGGGDNPKAAK